MSQQVAWPEVEVALDVLLELPSAARPAELQRMTAMRPELRAALEPILRHLDEPDELLDRPAIEALGGEARLPPDSAAGSRVGAYRLEALLGRGGMGEVYRASRADGQFEQQVAIKLVRREAGVSRERFQSERQILAQLDHPGIARLFDGGITEDGRPFMAMELVNGQDLVTWCTQRALTLEKRLELFLQVCDAVAYAHTHLIVHRDLKPGNILVSGDGRVKLLDFGIAKDLDASPLGQATQTLHLSPVYAAPEQLTGRGITTATDVYALGVILYELLTGRLPLALSDLPLAAVVHRLLESNPPAPSSVAAPGFPVHSRELQGDLDAIVAKALRAQPQARYPDARLLSDDIARFLRHEPVRAREGARAYVFQRFLRRNWLPLSMAALVFAALVAGMIGINVEANHARREAARATAAKDFLISIFEASDPRIASDKPRGQVTAKELLDASAGRIHEQFRDDPDTQIALLGTVMEIYDLQNDVERSQALRRQQVDVARATYGELHPVVLENLLDDVMVSLRQVDLKQARALLDRADGLIHRAGLDRSTTRARWWLQEGQLLWSDPSTQLRTQALTKAVNLYAAVAPTNEDFPVALNELALTRMFAGDYTAAIALFRQGLDVARHERIPDDSVQVTLGKNLAVALSHEGHRSQAEAALQVASQLAERTYGPDDRHYWEVMSDSARMIHEDGDRARSLQEFASLLEKIPPADGTFRNASDKSVAAAVRETYGHALASEGRLEEAIVYLKSAESVYQTIPRHSRDLPRVRYELGDAFDRAGHSTDARQMLQSAVDGYTAQGALGTDDGLLAWERWGRFLFSQGDSTAAEAAFQSILKLAGKRDLTATALAEGDLAVLRLSHSDPLAAVLEAKSACDRIGRVTGDRDVRRAAYLQLIYARALLASGDRSAAREQAQSALNSSRRFDDPASPDIRAAERVLQDVTQGAN